MSPGGGGWAGGASAYTGSIVTYGAGGGASFIAAGASNASVTSQSIFGSGQVFVGLVTPLFTAPSTTIAPALTGTPTFGASITTDNGSWANAPNSYTYQWFACTSQVLATCVAVVGATSNTFSPTYLQDQKYLAVRVTSTNSSGSAAAWSAYSSVVTTAALLTTCGTSGATGPTSSACVTAYSAANQSNLLGSNSFVVSSPTGLTTTNGYQFWTVPASGIYRIQAMGASLSGATGYSAIATGDFTLVQGETLKILVGQQPKILLNPYIGGGGGSFVTKFDNTPLVVGGGGGGEYPNATGGIASIVGTQIASGAYAGATATAPGAGLSYSYTCNTPGSNITGSAAASCNGTAAGGAGFAGDNSFVGSAFLNGGIGANPDCLVYRWWWWLGRW